MLLLSPVLFCAAGGCAGVLTDAPIVTVCLWVCGASVISLATYGLIFGRKAGPAAGLKRRVQSWVSPQWAQNSPPDDGGAGDI